MRRFLVLLLVINIGFLTACATGKKEGTGNTESVSDTVSSTNSEDAITGSESEGNATGSESEGNATGSESEGDTETFGFEDLAEAPFLFASGVGGWGTMLNINSDGSFFGDYHDSEMGLTGADFNGTVYQCTFSGKFTDLKMESEGLYTMRVSELAIEKTEGMEEILDGVKFIYTTPYGIYNDSVVKIYLPDIDISSFSEDFRMWVMGSYYFEGDILPVMALETTDSVDTYVFTQQK